MRAGLESGEVDSLEPAKINRANIRALALCSGRKNDEA